MSPWDPVSPTEEPTVEEASAPETAPETAPESPSWGVLDEAPPFFPPVPESLEDTGLTGSQITDLLLKTLYEQGAMEGDVLARTVALPFTLIDDLILTAQQRHFVEVLEAHGHGRGGYTFNLTTEGRTLARAALETSRYVGPAPVPLEQFKHTLEMESVRDVHVRRQVLEEAFSDLVLPDGVLDALGPALNSGGSIFLHGAPGNGKTAIAERVGSLTSSTIFLPRALMIQGNIMVLYDPVFHEAVEVEEGEATFSSTSSIFRDGPVYDQRYVKVKRPTVFVGGELTLDQLDLQYDPYSKVYQAPFQLKAAGGVLIIDDFGRQRMRPAELLNRWIVPLEKGFDNLTLHSGIKFPVPFDCILIFATNLNPSDLVDEAFLRRIQYKVEIRSPTRSAFEGIMRMNCEEFGVPYRQEAVDLLYAEYYNAKDFSPRGCHPRDLIKQIQAAAAFKGVEARLEPAAIHQAAHSYFLVTEEEFQAGVPAFDLGQGD
jgi:predicted ATPase with chaperone activity